MKVDTRVLDRLELLDRLSERDEEMGYETGVYIDLGALKFTRGSDVIFLGDAWMPENRQKC